MCASREVNDGEICFQLSSMNVCRNSPVDSDRCSITDSSEDNKNEVMLSQLCLPSLQESVAWAPSEPETTPFV